jgi:hypothetical protein
VVDEQHARAIVLALWPKLKHDTWDITHERDLDDYGDGVPFTSVCSGKIERAPKKHARVSIPFAMIATTHDGVSVILTIDTYRQTYIAMTGDEQRELYRALMGDRPPPYRLTTDRNGVRYVSTNRHGWDWNGSRHARLALHKIAGATTVAPPRHFANAPPVAVGR